MNISLINFKPKYQLERLSVDCLPTCLQAMLDYNELPFEIERYVGELKSDQYGFDLLEFMSLLAKYNLVVEIGLGDQDYLGQLSRKVLSLIQLRSLLAKSKNLLPHQKKGLSDIIEFAERYPNLIKVRQTKIADLLGWLNRQYPVGITLGIAEFANIDDDSIHSVIITGLEGETVSIWDPVQGHLAGPLENLVTAWQAVGGYYFVLKKSGDLSN